MYAAASLPVRNGSSEKDSKFLPPRGDRCMHTVGARSTFAPRALASSARCCPTSWIRSRFHVAANETPHGKSAAFGDVRANLLPVRVSARKLTGVPFLKYCPRAPFGPSVVLIDGIPRWGRGTVLQKSAPANRDTCFVSAWGNKVEDLQLKWSAERQIQTGNLENYALLWRKVDKVDLASSLSQVCRRDVGAKFV